MFKSRERELEEQLEQCKLSIERWKLHDRVVRRGNDCKHFEFSQDVLKNIALSNRTDPDEIKLVYNAIMTVYDEEVEWLHDEKEKLRQKALEALEGKRGVK